MSEKQELTDEQKQLIKKRVLVEVHGVLKTAQFVQKQLNLVFELSAYGGCVCGLMVGSWAAVADGMSRKDYLLQCDSVFRVATKMKEAQEEVEAKALLAKAAEDEDEEKAAAANLEKQRKELVDANGSKGASTEEAG